MTLHASRTGKSVLRSRVPARRQRLGQVREKVRLSSSSMLGRLAGTRDRRTDFPVREA